MIPLPSSQSAKRRNSRSTDIARRHGGSFRLGDSAHLGGLSADLVLPR